MNTSMWRAGILTVLAVTLFNCGSGSSGNGGCVPTDPACNPTPKTQMSLVNPIHNLTIAEGDTIFCDGNVEITPPSESVAPQWWLKGNNEWMKVRGDSIWCSCAPVPGTGREYWALNYAASGGVVKPPPGDYTITVHARVWVQFPGQIVATENRALHIMPAVQ